MAVFNKEETGNNSSVDNESQPNSDIFERPRGLKGLYSHPMTQVSIGLRVDGLQHCITRFNRWLCLVLSTLRVQVSSSWPSS